MIYYPSLPVLMDYVPRPKDPEEWAWLIFLGPTVATCATQTAFFTHADTHTCGLHCMCRASGLEDFAESKPHG